MGPFWALTTRMLGGAAAAGGVATITMLGALGGFVGPYLTGRLRDTTNSFASGLYLIGALALAAAMLSLAVRRQDRLNVL
jgi:MFS transporter, ACS family, tartrate transporter